jgi:hypothetical protein
VQRARADVRCEPREIERAPEQPAQRRRVEEVRGGARIEHPAERKVARPHGGKTSDGCSVAAEDLLDRELAPQAPQSIRATHEIVSRAGERDGVDRSGRHAGDDLERDRRSRRERVGDAAQHSSLVCAARAAAREDEPEPLLRVASSLHRRATKVLHARGDAWRVPR